MTTFVPFSSLIFHCQSSLNSLNLFAVGRAVICTVICKRRSVVLVNWWSWICEICEICEICWICILKPWNRESVDFKMQILKLQFGGNGLLSFETDEISPSVSKHLLAGFGFACLTLVALKALNIWIPRKPPQKNEQNQQTQTHEE